jgi:polyisoprenoid-binding protein YceI
VPDGQLHVVGDLTMHGVTQLVTIPVDILGTGTNPMNGKKQVGLVGDLRIKASEYGVNSWENFKAVLGDEVTIEIVVEANAG